MAQPAPSKIGIVARRTKPGAAEWARRFFDKLSSLGAQVLVDEEIAPEIDAPEALPRSQVVRADAVVVMGGDGTLLAVAHEAAPLGTPLVGVDLGSFGFLAEEEPAAVLDRLENLLAGRFEIEERTMIRAVVLDSAGSQRASFLGLNDAVIAKTGFRRLIRLRCDIDDEHLATYPADGIIIATPTGSTAYNLSAGGPIVDPRVDCLLVNAICPHTLYTRPLVIDASSRLQITIEAPYAGHVEAVELAVDGQRGTQLQPGESVVITRAEEKTRLIRLTHQSFFERLRDKLKWGALR